MTNRTDEAVKLSMSDEPSSDASDSASPAADGLLNEASRLLIIARQASWKLGLQGRGGDISLSHEVRMFAEAFTSGGAEHAWQKAAGQSLNRLAQDQALASHPSEGGEGLEAGKRSVIEAAVYGWATEVMGSDLDSDKHLEPLVDRIIAALKARSPESGR